MKNCNPLYGSFILVPFKECLYQFPLYMKFSGDIFIYFYVLPKLTLGRKNFYLQTFNILKGFFTPQKISLFLFFLLKIKAFYNTY